MTLDDLACTLPNGFHDAEITSIRIDYVRRKVEIMIDVWVGDSESRETYRPATLTLSGLRYCCIEPPDGRYPFQNASTLTVSTGTVESLAKPPDARLPDMPHTVGFTNWFFVEQWNAFLYVSAQDASLAWHDG